jgi:type IV pilus assembly protein PilB
MLIIPNQKLKETLVQEGLISAEEFDKLAAEAGRMEQSVVDFLISRRFINSDYFYNFASKYFGVELANLGAKKIDEEVLRQLSEDYAKQKRAIIFAKEENGTLDAAMEDPNDLETIEFLKRNLKANIKPFLATPDDLNKGFALYGKQFTQDFKKTIEENIQASLSRKTENMEEAAKDLPIVSTVDTILSYAISLHASDIHIEILEDSI